MDCCYSGEKAVDYGYVADGVHLTPYIGNFSINWQDTLGELQRERLQPGFKVGGLREVAATAGDDDAFAQFATDNDQPALIVSTTDLNITEGESVNYQIKLATEPTGEVDVIALPKPPLIEAVTPASGIRHRRVR